MSNIYGILEDIRRPYPKEYERKQIHHVPEMEVVENRVNWIVEQCQDKTVLDIGCASGGLHEKLKAVAAMIVGIDRETCDHPTAAVYDLDITPPVREMPFQELPIELIVCGEVIEHLCNPGQALQALARTWPSAQLIVTVPNAFSSAGQRFMKTGIENVNADHVAWYSWWTMTQLLERNGWDVLERYWYGGEPLTAEGLVFLCAGPAHET